MIHFARELGDSSRMCPAIEYVCDRIARFSLEGTNNVYKFSVLRDTDTVALLGATRKKN